MNDETTQAIDVEEERRWIIDHRTAINVGTREIARLTGIPHGTISQFMSDKGYGGREENVAEKVARYRQSLAAQAAVEIEPRTMPDWFDTGTSARLFKLFNFARLGELVAAAMVPGTGKTKAAKRFAWTYPNVFHVTMTSSTAGVPTMQAAVLEAMGERDAKGTPQALSRKIRNRVEQLRNALIIIDEAQHLSAKALDEIRSWNDLSGVGIALLGDTNLLTQLAKFSQLFSRISAHHVQTQAMETDVAPLAAAWAIEKPEMIAFIRDLAMRPGALRRTSKALRLAHMMADAEGLPLELAHLKDAAAQVSVQARA